jgi:hypothetical protein
VRRRWEEERRGTSGSINHTSPGLTRSINHFSLIIYLLSGALAAQLSSLRSPEHGNNNLAGSSPKDVQAQGCFFLRRQPLTKMEFFTLSLHIHESDGAFFLPALNNAVSAAQDHYHSLGFAKLSGPGA